MILTAIAFILLLIREGQLSEHKILFGVILVIGIITTTIRQLGTAHWPDGSVDRSRSAPVLQLVPVIFGVQCIFFVWVCIAMWF